MATQRATAITVNVLGDDKYSQIAFTLGGFIGDIIGQFISLTENEFYGVTSSVDFENRTAPMLCGPSTTEELITQMKTALHNPETAPSTLRIYGRKPATSFDNSFNAWDETLAMTFVSLDAFLDWETEQGKTYGCSHCSPPTLDNDSHDGNFAQFLVNYILALSDEEYNHLVEVWVDRIQKTLKAHYPYLADGDMALAFTNTSTVVTEE